MLGNVSDDERIIPLSDLTVVGGNGCRAHPLPNDHAQCYVHECCNGLTADRCELDHTTCPPGVHDFDARDLEDQNRGEGGIMCCNDCWAILFYCPRTGWYHHARKNVEPCFLVRDRSWDVEIEVPWLREGSS